MMKITVASFMALAVLAFSAPASLAGEDETEVVKSEATCSCTARHEAMMTIRDLLKEMKAQEEAEAAANDESGAPLPEEEAQAGS